MTLVDTNILIDILSRRSELEDVVGRGDCGANRSMARS